MLKKNLLIFPIMLLLISSIIQAAEKGQLIIKSDISEAMVYINSKPKAMVGDGGITTINLKEGMYTIKVEKSTANSEWIYTKTKKVFVGEDTSTKLTFKLDKKSTKKRTTRLKNVEKQRVNNINKKGFIEPEMVLIKSGEFIMGGDGPQDERPVHTVKIKKDFFVAKYEVSFAEYDMFSKSTGKKIIKDSGYGRASKPVINISYNQAIEYIQWLNKKSDKKYRLLTEEEWEYTARAGSLYKWCFGSDESKLKEFAWYDKNANKVGKKHKDYGTHPIGTKKPNLWGVYDMHGNVWEWTDSWYSKDYSSKKIKEYKVMRGGAWYYSAESSRSAIRSYDSPQYSYNYLGFRLARTK